MSGASSVPQFHGSAALGMYVRRLLSLLEQQVAESLADHGCEVKANCTTALLLLYKTGDQSLADIARELSYSHQLATLLVRWLEENGFVRLDPDPHDRRRRVVSLTRYGKAEGRKLERYLVGLAAAYDDLFSELELDLRAAVERAQDALKRHSLAARMPAPAKARK